MFTLVCQRGCLLLLIAVRQIAICLAISSAVCAAPGDLMLKIPNPDVVPGPVFGRAIAAHDGKILVGVPCTNVGGVTCVGEAYVIDAATGEFLLTIPNPVVRERDQFGASIVGVADKIVVSTAGSANNLYVFNADTGDLIHDITIPNPGAEPSFDAPMAVVGDNVLVGLQSHKVDGVPRAGAAYLISPHTGELLLRIANPEPGIFDRFGGGSGVAALGGKHVVGAPGDDINVEKDSIGRVFVFDGDTGEELLRLENPRPEGFLHRFGGALASIDNRVIVGSPLQDVDGKAKVGIVFVFDGITGDLLFTIRNPEPGIQDQFGETLATVGSDILVGTPGDFSRPSDGDSIGSAYLFDGLTGRLLLKIENPDANFTNFGSDVAAVDNNLLISSFEPSPDGHTIDGSVFIFEGVPAFLLGDTDRNGVVDIEDLNNVRNNFRAAGQGLLGDTNGDMSVDIDDLNNVRNQFGTTADEPTAVPEPPALATMLISVAAVFFGLVRYRRPKLRGSA